MAMFDIRSQTSGVFATFCPETAGGRRSALLRELMGGPILLVRDMEEARRYEATAVLNWQEAANGVSNTAAPTSVRSDGLDVYYLRDGAVRSVGLPEHDPWAASVRANKCASASVGDVLNNKFFVLSPSQREEVGEFVSLMCEFNISKFNHFDIPRPGLLSGTKERVLVLLDSEISEGLEKEIQLLTGARDRFPQAHIIVRPHPLCERQQRTVVDVIVRKVNAEWMASIWNPMAVLKIVDVVFAGRSQLGFEAVLLGKPVYCYGDTFYNGWGLTEDLSQGRERKLSRNILDIAYAMYLEATRYIDVNTRERCSPVEAVWGIARRRYADEHSKALMVAGLPHRERALVALGAMHGDQPYTSEQLRLDLRETTPQLIDREFAKLLTGRTVALVGPAATLKGQRLGKLIDQYEVVVRLNTSINGYPFSPSISEDIGASLDILYLGLGTARSDDNVLKNLQANGIRLPVAIVDHEAELEQVVSRVSAETSALRIEALTEGQVRVAGGVVRMLNRWLGKYMPRTGLAAIVDLLVHGPKELFVAGFTFYDGGGHSHRRARTELTTTSDIGGGVGFHNSERELHVLDTLRHVFPKVLCLDDTLARIVDNAKARPVSVEWDGEWGYELIAVLPYAYWLHVNGLLAKVVSASDTKCLYSFAQQHEEQFTERRGRMPSGFPMDRIHVRRLDKKKWLPPPLKTWHQNSYFVFDKEPFVIGNNITHEWRGRSLDAGGPINYYSVETLRQIILLLEDKFTIIYNRPTQKDIIEDQSPCLDFEDHEMLRAEFPDVILMQDLHKEHQEFSFNALQCAVYANCRCFATVQGGGSIFASYFLGQEGRNFVLAKKGKELEFNSYRWYKELSGGRVDAYQDEQELIRAIRGFVVDG